MNIDYTVPELLVADLCLVSIFFLSIVDGTGGNLSGYEEDDENVF